MPIAFEAKVVADGPGKAWFHATFPKEVTEHLGTQAAVKVHGTINGHKFRSSAFPTGEGTHRIMVNRTMRDATGLADGARARFVLDRDTKPRTVRLPAELRRALAEAPKAKACYDSLAPSHKQAYAEHVAEAKKPETRQRRAQQTVERLALGKRPE
ncbi:MAG: YdeI/OmpD-associated family protein [Halobacteriales archaeon]|nr:YdeI/OmpD-associated family protein [Halobacteriales archaeon]